MTRDERSVRILPSTGLDAAEREAALARELADVSAAGVALVGAPFPAARRVPLALAAPVAADATRERALRDTGDIRSWDATGRPVDCRVAHVMGSSDACATCSLNRLRDESKPATNGWLAACVITLSIALPVMASLVVAMLVWD